MATRNGKANTIVSKTGSASPRVVQFRRGGLASVWNWENTPAGNDPTSKTFSRSADCLVCVGLKAARFADTALAVSGARALESDARVAVTGIVDVAYDERQQIVGRPNVDALFDTLTGVTNAWSISADQSAVIRNSHAWFCDMGVLVTHVLDSATDLQVRVNEARGFSGAVDTGYLVVRPAGSHTDLSIRVVSDIEAVADVGVVTIRAFGIDADVMQQVLGVRTLEQLSDMRLVISAGSIMPKDIALETDLLVSLYVFLIRETHLIQV